MAVSKRTRFEVLRRDNYACRYCRSTDNPITVDHVLPTALGGTDNPDNLVAACRDCNAGKSSSSPSDALVADVAADAVRWSRAMQAASRILSASRADRDAYAAKFHQEWNAWTWDDIIHFPLPNDWPQRMWQFFEAGLPIDEVVDAVDIALRKTGVSFDDKWRYFCGICWKRLTAIQELARQQTEWTEAAD